MAKNKNVTKILVSVIFIALGVDSVVRAFQILLDLDLAGILSCTLGLLMFVMGIFGILRNQIKVCRVLAVIVCILSTANFIVALAGGAFQTQMLISALLAWIYFDCA